MIDSKQAADALSDIDDIVRRVRQSQIYDSASWIMTWWGVLVFAGNIATWADRYQPPADERNPRLGRYPYLADDYALTERVAGATPWISNVHLFAFASTMSFGPSGSSINAMTTAIPKLVYGLTRGLFRADIERYWDSFRAYDVPQAVIPAKPGR